MVSPNGGCESAYLTKRVPRSTENRSGLAFGIPACDVPCRSGPSMETDSSLWVRGSTLEVAAAAEGDVKVGGCKSAMSSIQANDIDHCIDSIVKVVVTTTARIAFQKDAGSFHARRSGVRPP